APFLDIATVHLAIHDAVAAIDHQFQPYNVTISWASGSLVAAVAAAHDVLVNRFPAQAESLDSAYSENVGTHGLSHNDPGIAVGRRSASGIIAFRADDGSFPSQAQPPFTGGSAPGQWRPTPPALASMATPWLATVRPFALTSPQQFRANPPPSLTSQL